MPSNNNGTFDTIVQYIQLKFKWQISDLEIYFVETDAILEWDGTRQWSGDFSRINVTTDVLRIRFDKWLNLMKVLPGYFSTSKSKGINILCEENESLF